MAEEGQVIACHNLDEWKENFQQRQRFPETGMLFFSYMVEDKTPGGLSYVEFLVLAEHKNNVTALFRRGKARGELGQTDAREDFLKARKNAPEDKAIARELYLLAEHDKAVYQRLKSRFKKEI
ncbi:hypothetical protein HHK36_005006 [Tetracentron sinense]|uniref:Uncharacterized protein n=1 Tax=Tetracentron sinense TaxID=13715 RepID=A0A834ZT90_TETSI|nr:hypothetical protein HHK36_005006 [Tetracentron sinense]